MYFSARQFAPPPGGSITFAIDFAATIIGGAPGDLYDGFVSFNVLDFSTGAALDFFVGNDTIATVYGKLPFPGIPDVTPERGPRFFCLFEEMRNTTSQGQLRHFEMPTTAPKMKSDFPSMERKCGATLMSHLSSGHAP